MMAHPSSADCLKACGLSSPLVPVFPAVVTGTVVLSIGLSLISVGVASAGGGSSAQDYGSVENLLVALAVLVVIPVLKHCSKGMLSYSCILIGIIVGYGSARCLRCSCPARVTAEGVSTLRRGCSTGERLPVRWFACLSSCRCRRSTCAIAPVMIMFIVTAVETWATFWRDGGRHRPRGDR